MLGGIIVTVGFLLFPDDPFCLSLGAAQIHEPRFLFKESAISFQWGKYFYDQKNISITFYNRKERSLQWEPKRFQLRHQSRLRIRWIVFRLTNCPIRCLAKEGLLCLLLQKNKFPHCSYGILITKVNIKFYRCTTEWDQPTGHQHHTSDWNALLVGNWVDNDILLRYRK